MARENESKLDREIRVMKAVSRAIAELDQDGKIRVLAHVQQLVETGRPSAEEGK